jgi:hypothetical protein
MALHSVLRSLCLTAAPFALAASVSAQTAPTVAAASSLNFALTEIAEHFARDGGGRVGLVFGASGTLTRQIRVSAPRVSAADRRRTVYRLRMRSERALVALLSLLTACGGRSTLDAAGAAQGGSGAAGEGGTVAAGAGGPRGSGRRRRYGRRRRRQRRRRRRRGGQRSVALDRTGLHRRRVVRQQPGGFLPCDGGLLPR